MLVPSTDRLWYPYGELPRADTASDRCWGNEGLACETIICSCIIGKSLLTNVPNMYIQFTCISSWKAWVPVRGYILASYPGFPVLAESLGTRLHTFPYYAKVLCMPCLLYLPTTVSSHIRNVTQLHSSSPPFTSLYHYLGDLCVTENECPHSS